MNKIYFKPFMSILCLFPTLHAWSQNVPQDKYTATNKGKFFISWGGNRESFSKSDIRFKGDNYDITIHDATAKDRPKGWHIDYINPTKITIPQTNVKLGYYISNNYVISFGVDHMKYVMQRNESRRVEGYIDLPTGEAGSVYNGQYNNDLFMVSEDFLKFEHTNGLNYGYFEFARVDDLSSIFKIQNTDKVQINFTEGVGAGFLYPKTNTTLLQKDRYDEFHLAGFGLSINAGINVTFFKHFFIETDLKGGYINMPDIRTTSNTSESASQHFFYLQRIIYFGGIFRI